jgi:hypothetical protein
VVEHSSSTASEKPVPEKVEKDKHDYDYTTFAQVFKEHQSMEQSSIGSYYVRGFTRFMQKVTTKASGICSSVRQAHLKIEVTTKTFLFSKLITQ